MYACGYRARLLGSPRRSCTFSSLLSIARVIGYHLLWDSLALGIYPLKAFSSPEINTPGILRVSGRKWSAGSHGRPFYLPGTGPCAVRPFSRRETRGGALRAVAGSPPFPAARVPTAPRRWFRRGRPESHMMSQTVTQAGCLIPAPRPAGTMSPPGPAVRCVPGARAWPRAPGPCASHRRRPPLGRCGLGRAE